MSECIFKCGDIIKCVMSTSSNFLTFGKQYHILSIVDDIYVNIVNDVDEFELYWWERFELDEAATRCLKINEILKNKNGEDEYEIF